MRQLHEGQEEFVDALTVLIVGAGPTGLTLACEWTLRVVGQPTGLDDIKTGVRGGVRGPSCGCPQLGLSDRRA
ncbi:hypothetical protein GCM10009555_059290 [Acrocarpospora macrocephala]|uniref:Uncharacterized protein n=1 Tax=Acrocarpospora macrocephala TaxID=150177 RepID=A0A5M3WTJ9_9ACTN|nr:hypothetical protein Amac_054430 [Acrocarpospora macrocephala]